MLEICHNVLLSCCVKPDVEIVVESRPVSLPLIKVCNPSVFIIMIEQILILTKESILFFAQIVRVCWNVGEKRNS